MRGGAGWGPIRREEAGGGFGCFLRSGGGGLLSWKSTFVSICIEKYICLVGAGGGFGCFLRGGGGGGGGALHVDVEDADLARLGHARHRRLRASIIILVIAVIILIIFIIFIIIIIIVLK